MVLQQLKSCLEQLFDVRSIDGLLPKMHTLSFYVGRTWVDLQKLHSLLFTPPANRSANPLPEAHSPVLQLTGRRPIS